MVKQQHQLFVSLLAAVDAAVVACACLVAWGVRRMLIEEFWPASWETYFKETLVFFTVPITLYAMWAFGLYRPRRERPIFSEIAQIVKASGTAIGAIVVILWVVGNAFLAGMRNYGTVPFAGLELDAARIQLGVLALALPGALSVHRVTFRTVLRMLRRRGWNLRHVAIIGVGRLGQITARTLDRNPWTGLNVSYFISEAEHTRRERCVDRPVLGGLADLERVLEQHRVDAVYLALSSRRTQARPSILARLERFPVDVRIVPDILPRYLPQSMVVSELDGMPILSYRECPTRGLGGLSKRILDIVGASVALALFAPVIGIAALLIRLSGPGPVIFKQRRVSLGGETFKIYKLRTMYHVEDEQSPHARPPAWTERDDPRITPVGRWLRRTSLDELPQLLNVIKGDMSLVGPRPERPELIARFRDDWRGYMLRHHVKAGITGWAQVNGLRGQSSLRKRIQYDLFYIRHWSLGFDLRILWLTLFRGFVHQNAR